jgi:hypothetical protein
MTKELQNYSNTTAMARATMNAMGSIESNRAIAEVQGQVLMAKQFPRNQIEARANILEACKRVKLAETAIYSYPRGGSRIEGPSIRLAEMLAQYWGNIDYGIIELEQKAGVDKKAGESVMMAYCRDIQTNTRRQIVFNVPHIRQKRGGNQNLSDPRDIYELVANMGARRLRACIMGIIPGDIIEEAVEACNKTLLGENDEPLIDRIKKMVTAFQTIGISQGMLEERVGHKMEVSLPTEIVQLRKIYKSIQDGISKPADWFRTLNPNTPAPPSPDESIQPEKENSDSAKKAQSESDKKEELHPEAQHLKELWEDPAYQPVFEELIKDDKMDAQEINYIIANNQSKAAVKIVAAVEAKIG